MDTTTQAPEAYTVYELRIIGTHGVETINSTRFYDKYLLKFNANSDEQAVERAKAIVGWTYEAGRDMLRCADLRRLHIAADGCTIVGCAHLWRDSFVCTERATNAFVIGNSDLTRYGLGPMVAFGE